MADEKRKRDAVFPEIPTGGEKMKIPIGIDDLTNSRFLGKFQELRASYCEAGMDYVSATNLAWEETNDKN